jgi:hypothetical protein
MKTTQRITTSTERPVVARGYFMRYFTGPQVASLSTIFVYAGLSEQRRHIFVGKPLWMDIPTDQPMYTRLFEEQQLEIFHDYVSLDHGLDQENVQPGTLEHKRLNDILIEYQDSIRQEMKQG